MAVMEFLGIQTLVDILLVHLMIKPSVIGIFLEFQRKNVHWMQRQSTVGIPALLKMLHGIACMILYLVQLEMTRSSSCIVVFNISDGTLVLVLPLKEPM